MLTKKERHAPCVFALPKSFDFELFPLKYNITPSKPNPMKNLILPLLRHALTFAGGLLAAKGYLDESSVTEIVGATISLVSVLWMTFEKKK
jgi:hypothetical protein